MNAKITSISINADDGCGLYRSHFSATVFRADGYEQRAGGYLNLRLHSYLRIKPASLKRLRAAQDQLVRRSDRISTAARTAVLRKVLRRAGSELAGCRHFYQAVRPDGKYACKTCGQIIPHKTLTKVA